jgi:TonB family protein
MPPITRSIFGVLLLLVLMVGATPIQQASAQDSSPARKIVRQTVPVYPPLARQVNLVGTVKLIAVVAADGKVKAVEPVGGSPLLIEAAKDAIARWKFAPAPAESREVIELHFHP